MITSKKTAKTCKNFRKHTLLWSLCSVCKKLYNKEFPSINLLSTIVTHADVISNLIYVGGYLISECSYKVFH